MCPEKCGTRIDEYLEHVSRFSVCHPGGPNVTKSNDCSEAWNPVCANRMWTTQRMWSAAPPFRNVYSPAHNKMRDFGPLGCQNVPGVCRKINWRSGCELSLLRKRRAIPTLMQRGIEIWVQFSPGLGVAQCLSPLFSFEVGM